MKFFPIVNQDVLIRVWPTLAPMIEPVLVLMGNRFIVKDIFKNLIADGSPFLTWVATEDDNKIVGTLISQIITFPQRRCLAMPIVGGTRFEEWELLIEPEMRKYAVLAGCDQLEGYGRRGWERVYGVKPAAQVYLVDLKDNNDGGANA